MRNPVSRRASAVALALVLASCGGGGGVAPQLPTTPSVAPASGAPASAFDLVSSQGAAPEGFELKMRLDPHPSEDGIIHDASPTTVNVDLCGSTPDPGKALRFYFDWDKDGRAEVEGTGDDCVQKHTYRFPADATKAVVLESNVCVTNGDPNVHDGSVYFSCRTIRVALPLSAAGCGANGVPEGCYSAFFGSGFVYWPGGSGPTMDTAAFFDPACEELQDPAPFPIVVACSLAAAQQLCGFDDIQSYGPIADGQSMFGCGGFSLKAQARSAPRSLWSLAAPNAE